MEMIKKIFQKLTLTRIIIIGFIVRIVAWPWVNHGDVNALYWWGKFAVDFSWRGFYDWLDFGGHSRPDQPMLNIFYDYGVRQFYLFFYRIFWYLNVNIPMFPSKFMQWYFDYGNQYLLKLPMILADLLIIYFGYQFTKSKKIALILALYPPLIYNSAVWGSGDSIICLFALVSLYLIYNQRYLLSVIFFLGSVLFKPSLLIWTPVMLVILIKNKISFIKILFTAFFLFILIYLISSPFNPVDINPLVWFYQTMTTKILPGFLDTVTANAMNLWVLIYSFKPLVDNFLIFNIITARNFSLIICLILYVLILIKLIRNYSVKTLLLTLVNITLVTFCFMTRMHERYTFPALIPLLLLSYQDRRFIKYFIILTFTHLINVYSAFFIPFIPIFTPLFRTDILIRLVSLINVIITLKLVFLPLPSEKL